MRRACNDPGGGATGPRARLTPPRSRAALLVAAIVVVACSACHTSAPTAPTTPTAAEPTARMSVPEAPDRPVTKLLVLIVENRSRDQMRREMPYTSMLADTFGYAADFYGVTYPSLPNYLAITSGSTHDVADDRSPSKHVLAGPSVFGEALAHARTATVFADGMPSNCDADAGGDRYQVKHNPWVYYRSERGLCQSHDVPGTQLSGAVAAGRLPNAGLIVPNMCNDAHDCNLKVADSWIHATLGGVFDGPDWRSGHLAVVITADTDDRKAHNNILTVVVHPSQHHDVVEQRLDHYSLSRLYSDVVHAPPLGHAASAASMSDAFGLPLG